GSVLPAERRHARDPAAVPAPRGHTAARGSPARAREVAAAQLGHRRDGLLEGGDGADDGGALAGQHPPARQRRRPVRRARDRTVDPGVARAARAAPQGEGVPAVREGARPRRVRVPHASARDDRRQRRAGREARGGPPLGVLQAPAQARARARAVPPQRQRLTPDGERPTRRRATYAPTQREYARTQRGYAATYRGYAQAPTLRGGY